MFLWSRHGAGLSVVLGAQLFMIVILCVGSGLGGALGASVPAVGLIYPSVFSSVSNMSHDSCALWVRSTETRLIALLKAVVIAK